MFHVTFACLVLSLIPSVFPSLSPGSYFIQNVGFASQRVFTDQTPTEVLPQQGIVVFTTNSPFPQDQVLSEHIFTVEGGTVFAETAQQFIVVDAHEGGTAGSGLILCNTTDPVPPFNPIGNSAWQFVQGSQGMNVFLENTNLVWAIQSTAFATQITIQTFDSSDLRQQWNFIAHGLV
ncbi:hypothetical protein SISSUDRAFT_1059300 [Sistotremastrum suecicum HHB10207 ss-3]|uniref:Ricin B lectin domain-containing protein n=1 Tax=Sistotremastrum suecicum HHB10207 ss-3 TaxID=1314776 RepID=A0A166GDG1_9AGAM|nr:hypothetical protein SISSUDRAFT_1059300 [Sistotremastrum suecicum HHB10207 ss-3]